MKENVKVSHSVSIDFNWLKGFCILLFLFSASLLSAQELQYRQNLPLTDSLQQQIQARFSFSKNSPSERIQGLRIPQYIIPTYARANPSGYSYLCRLELQIEDELPLGLWIRADEKAHPGGSVYLRMKLIRF